MNNTISFYETNVNLLISRYDSADMTMLHNQLLKYIPAKSRVIDIGFGSGRDLTFLQSAGYDIYGIDPVEEFVSQAKKRFPDIAGHFTAGSFLSVDCPLDWKNSFDAVISIAVWMHLKAYEHVFAIKTIKSLLKPNGVVVLSFSVGERDSDDGRYFEPLALQDVIDEFAEAGFTLIHSESTADSLGRDSIQWVTAVLKR